VTRVLPGHAAGPGCRSRAVLTDSLTRPDETGETRHDGGDRPELVPLVNETCTDLGDQQDVRRGAHNPATAGPLPPSSSDKITVPLVPLATVKSGAVRPQAGTQVGRSDVMTACFVQIPKLTVRGWLGKHPCPSSCGQAGLARCCRAPTSSGHDADDERWARYQLWRGPRPRR
jgi:hypothetical protein